MDAALFAVVAIARRRRSRRDPTCFPAHALRARSRRTDGGPRGDERGVRRGSRAAGMGRRVATGAMGFFWGRLYLRRRSIMAPMASHAGYNSLEIVRFLVHGAGGDMWADAAHAAFRSPRCGRPRLLVSSSCHCRRSLRASMRRTKCSTSHTCARSGSITTSRSRTNISISRPRYCGTPGFHETFLERTTETGRRINFATIGSALLWAPFFALPHLSTRLLNAPAVDTGERLLATIHRRGLVRVGVIRVACDLAGRRVWSSGCRANGPRSSTLAWWLRLSSGLERRSSFTCTSRRRCRTRPRHLRSRCS